MFAAWRAEGSAVNFALAYGTDEMLLGGADDVRTLQGTTARSARWKGFLSVGALFCCCQQLKFCQRNESYGLFSCRPMRDSPLPSPRH